MLPRYFISYVFFSRWACCRCRCALILGISLPLCGLLLFQPYSIQTTTTTTRRSLSLVFFAFSAFGDASFEAMFPMLCLRWAQLGVKLSPKGPMLRNVAHDLDVHVHHMVSIWGPSGWLSALLQPNMTNWRQL